MRAMAIAAIAAPVMADAGRIGAQNLRAAADYSKSCGGLSMFVMHRGEVIFEEYHNGHAVNRPNRLASGTKSFWGVAAAAAVDDGLIAMDERVEDTITEWQTDGRKSAITVRQLLHLTSGLDPSGRLLRGPRVSDKYAAAINVEALATPGAAFAYGPSHYFVFGEFLRRKLAAKNETPYDYLQRRILQPIGLNAARWSTDRAGNHQLSFGAFLTAREWAKFGELVRNGGEWEGKAIVSRESLAQCFEGSDANPAYGLTFWLNNTGVDAQGWTRKQQSGMPEDLVFAAGAGGQRLYIIPSRELTIVRQGEGARYDNGEFLSRLLGGSR
jgi:CubicO group peptidase (beta-lactamase class C family)